MSNSGESGTGLNDDERAGIDAIFDRRMTASHYDILGVPADADRKAIRDAYFGLSKQFHPDACSSSETLETYKARLDDVSPRAHPRLRGLEQPQAAREVTTFTSPPCAPLGAPGSRF